MFIIKSKMCFFLLELFCMDNFIITTLNPLDEHNHLFSHTLDVYTTSSSKTAQNVCV